MGAVIYASRLVLFVLRKRIMYQVHTSLSYTLSYSFTALFVNEMINSDI